MTTNITSDRTSAIDVQDIISIHRDVSGLLRNRSIFETTERRFLTILERILSDYLVEYWMEQERQEEGGLG
ncbi:MAG: hypothetical protein WAK17_27830 [Candidatus Nitrosopolaris sp.]|jgi:hypothetical protein